MKLREIWEAEAQKRRNEIERGERHVQERDSNLDRKIDILDQREKEVARRVTDITRRETARSSIARPSSTSWWATSAAGWSRWLASRRRRPRPN